MLPACPCTMPTMVRCIPFVIVRRAVCTVDCPFGVSPAPVHAASPHPLPIGPPPPPPAATEAHDHDGLPHTLEHLIFMGSEAYPYKVP